MGANQTESEYAPLASTRYKSAGNLLGFLTARPTIVGREPAQPPREPLPFDTFALALGLYEAPQDRRARARREAIDLRERFELTEH